jgi:MFS family permease
VTEAIELDPSVPSGYLELVRANRDFRYLWFGQIVSLFGDWFNLIASAALVAQLTESGLAVGGLFVIRMLAQFFGTQVGGVAADRFSRKRLLILTDITRAIVVLGFLLVRDPSQVWLLYALTAALMAISGVFFPTRTAILPDVTSKREIGSANALSSTTWSVMLAVGSAIGGFAAGQWGIYQAFAVDATTFILSALLIARVRYEHPGSEQKADLRAVLQQYLDGFRYLRRELDVLLVTSHKAALGLSISGGAINVVMVRISESIFVIGEGGATSLGIIFAAVGAGTGIGPILSRRFTGDRQRALRLILAPMYLLAALGLIIAAQLNSFETVLLGMFLRTFAVGTIWVFTTQLLYQLVPQEYRGRVFSVEIAFFTLGSAIGAAIGGWALDATPINEAGIMWVMAAAGLIPAALWTVWMRLRPSREVPKPDGDADEGWNVWEST